MRTVKFNHGIVKIIGLLFIVLFIYTATDKLNNLAQFRFQLERFPFISPYAAIIAIMVPLLEIMIALLFLFEKHILIALYASLSLMILFTSYIIMVLNFSDSIPCSCGGVLSNLGWKSHIIFNCTFIFIALIGIIIYKKHQSYLSELYTT